MKKIRIVRSLLKFLSEVFSVRNTVKPVLSNHIQQDIFFAFQTGGCLLLHESSVEGACMSYFHSAISNHRSIAIFMSPEWNGRFKQV